MANTVAERFETISYETWRAAVEAGLKGVPFDKKLVHRTYEGIDLQPLYMAKDIAGLPAVESLPGFPPFVRGRTAAGYAAEPWDISQEIAFASALEFNTAARNSLDRGLTALNVALDQATRNGHDPDWAKPGEVGVGGLSIATFEDFERAFEGINLEKVSLMIRSGSSALPIAALLVALARKRGNSTHALRGCIEMDPLGVLSHEGSLPHSLKGAYREMAELTRWAVTHAPQLQTICIHARVWHEGGGTAVQELAFAMATAIDYFRALHTHELSADQVAPRTRIAFTIGSNYFMEIAKLRAARLLWSRIVKELGGAEASQKLVLHARTSRWNKTRFDPWVNILRATTEAFSAIVGGADSLQVGAFDEVLAPSDEFSRRLARNTQLILQKECDLTHVADPLGGCWYVEKLTDELARKAWNLVQEVEKRGGMAAALRSGFVQETIARSADQKRKDFAQRRNVLVGTTHYANPGEPTLSKTPFDAAGFERRRRQQILSYRTQADETQSVIVLVRLSRIVGAPSGRLLDLCVRAIVDGATLGEITRSIRIQDNSEEPVAPIAIERAAEPFERLRARVEACARQHQLRPSVFLAAMGPRAQHKARADFAKAFFETAGFAIVYPPGFKTSEEAAAAAVHSGAVIAVLCSTDESYPNLVGPFAAGVKATQPQMPVVLAGNPIDMLPAYRQAGIDDFIYMNCDALEVLKRTLDKVAIP